MNFRAKKKVFNFDFFFQHKQPNPAPEWLSENAWSDIVWATRLLRSLQNFMDHFREHIKAWKRFYDSTNPQDEELPEGMQKVEYVLDSFKQAKQKKKYTGIFEYFFHFQFFYF